MCPFPGDYLQNHCPKGRQNCQPCETRLPSCVGLPDQHNPFPGRPNTEFYIRCLSNRTNSVEACQVSLYDPVTRGCSMEIDTGKYVQYIIHT